MIRHLAAALAAVILAAGATAHATTVFRAPSVPAAALVDLPEPLEKSAPGVDAAGRLRVADVRALEKAAPVSTWHRAAGGFVARLQARSASAQGLRVRLALGTVPGALEVRVQGEGGPVESM